ncbi:RNase [Phlyctema vagabunda]|uniref:RNase n=1 Tax=Phlyctema vagabunda TaxID=108571 RepID=A0ABR4PQ10_9HELO
MSRVVPNIVTRAISKVMSLVPGVRNSTSNPTARATRVARGARRRAKFRARRQAQKTSEKEAVGNKNDEKKIEVAFGRSIRQQESVSDMDSSQRIAAVEAIISYKFSNPMLCLEALTTKGEASRTVKRIGSMTAEGNKRLALVGDAWLKVFTVSKWYHTAQTCCEASLMRSVLESNNNLERVGYFYGLDKLIIGGIGKKSVADMIEALVGAVAEDGGHAALFGVLEILGLSPKMDGAGRLSTVVHI